MFGLFCHAFYTILHGKGMENVWEMSGKYFCKNVALTQLNYCSRFFSKMQRESFWKNSGKVLSEKCGEISGKSRGKTPGKIVDKLLGKVWASFVQESTGFLLTFSKKNN